MARVCSSTHRSRRGARSVAAAFTVILMAACGAPQDEMGDMDMGAPAEEEQQEFAFAGTVTALDSTRNIVSVANDEIPGWMMSMTMNYYVQPAEVFGTLEPGDRITATVYSGDFQNLYEVEVVPDP